MLESERSCVHVAIPDFSTTFSASLKTALFRCHKNTFSLISVRVIPSLPACLSTASILSAFLSPVAVPNIHRADCSQ